MGRKPKMTPQQRKEALKRRDAGEAMRDIAKPDLNTDSGVVGAGDLVLLEFSAVRG
jgi:hypothetical protein